MMIETREFSITKTEYRRVLRRLFLRRSSGALAVAWLLAALVMFYQGGFGKAFLSWTPLLAALFLWTLWVVWVAPIRLANARTAVAAYRPRRIRFDSHALSVSTHGGGQSTLPYSTIERVAQSDDLLDLVLDSGISITIPRHAFATQQDCEAAVNLIRAGQSGEAADREAASPVGDDDTSVLTDGYRNVAAGLRLLFFRPFSPSAFIVNGDQVILLSVISIIAAIGAGYFGVDGKATFSAFGFLTDTSGRLLLLAAAYLVARFLGGTERFLHFAVIVLSVDPWVSAINSMAASAESLGKAAMMVGYLSFAAFLWYVIAWARAANIVFSDRPHRIAVALATLALVAVVPVTALPVNPYWYGDFVVDDALPDVNVEDVYYRQPALVSAVVDALEEERAGIVDLFHVGFGGEANQKVFRQEVTHVQRILDEQFDTRGRSIRLINHRETIDETPIASATNLRLTLEGVARKMDLDEDVLLLYLTSHGSSNGSLSVDFWPLSLNELSASDLRSMLNESGIRWRVIVVSACYSGTFIKPLMNDHTVVITASAHDRNSFGCSNENEFTYFGEAYFKDALSETRSFVDAFVRAKEIVTARERAESLKPSNPAIYVGPKVKDQLKKLEQRLSGQPQKAT